MVPVIGERIDARLGVCILPRIGVCVGNMVFIGDRIDARIGVRRDPRNGVSMGVVKNGVWNAGLGRVRDAVRNLPRGVGDSWRSPKCSVCC